MCIPDGYFTGYLKSYVMQGENSAFFSAEAVRLHASSCEVFQPGKTAQNRHRRRLYHGMRADEIQSGRQIPVSRSLTGSPWRYITMDLILMVCDTVR